MGGKETGRDGWPFESFPARTCVEEVLIFFIYVGKTWETSMIGTPQLIMIFAAEESEQY